MNRENDTAMADPLIGVSPAYVISRFGDRFTAEQMAAGLEDVAAMGFGGFQPEVFHRADLSDWQKRGASLVARQARTLGLQATQFVAHFMLHAFSTPQHLEDTAAMDDIRRVIDIVAHFDACRIITVPLGLFEAAAGDPAGEAGDHFRRFRDRIGRLAAVVSAAGCRMALEIMPGSVVGGIDGYLRLCHDLGPDAPGLNFDTGHAWAAGEDILRIPERLGKQILGTHLCDNFGHENLSLRPGAGSIDWPQLMRALMATHYDGAWDIEIICPPERYREEYGQAHHFMTTQIQPATAPLSAR
jgi:sugar phosphate isomerase/epimerase